MLVGLMILSQFFLDRARFEVGVLGLSTTQLLVIAIGGLAGINAMSVRAERYGDPTRVGRYAMAELSADTFLVVLLTTGSGGGGIGWVLIALPIVEAAVRFRLAGALLHWMAMAGVTLADGTAGGIEEQAITFPICRDRIDEYVLVDEAEIASAIRMMLARHHLLIEGAAALSVASFLRLADAYKGSRAVLIISGARISLETLRSVLEE